MRELTRDELQDRLPDLLHGRLSAADAVALERALVTDPELTAELELLRSVQTAHTRTPSIDITRIVSALPAAPVPAVAPEIDDLAQRRAAKRPMISYRFARAAALLVVVGGGTMVTLSSGRSGPATSVTAPVNSEAAAVAMESTASLQSMQLGLGSSLDELSVEQLRALEADIKSFDGVPSAEVDTPSDLFLTVEGA